MKYFKILLFVLLCTTNSFAQITSGKITYKVTKEFNTDSDYYRFYQMQYPDCFYEEFADEIEYVLEFTKDQALFYINTEGIINTSCIDKIGAVVGSMSADTYAVYTNKQYYTYMFHLGKHLLIKKKPFEWIITDETKQIQNFTCYKAYYKEVVDLGENETKTFTHTIWFTPELPFQYGAYYYFGTPGLVLEANHEGGKYTYGVSKIELNTENKNLSNNIKKLEDVSKKITLEEFMEM